MQPVGVGKILFDRDNFGYHRTQPIKNVKSVSAGTPAPPVEEK